MARGVLLLAIVCAARGAFAQSAPDPWSAPVAGGAPGADAASSATPGDAVKLGGFVELYEQWNFRQPSNGVTNLRGFDERSDSFTLQNATVDATWTRGRFSGRIALQFGDEPDAEYLVEPMKPASGTAPASGPVEWRNIQEAWVAWQVPCSKLELSGGLFLSPIGPEVLSVRDNWNWSRSNLFYLLPYYHVGVRAKLPIGDTHWSAMLAVYNGWNDAVDNNTTPSVAVIAQYVKGPWTGQVQYFGGIQRPTGAPEGQPWRSLGDAYLQGPIPRIAKLWFLVHADAGFEDSAFGTASWVGFAGSLKYDVAPKMFVAARGDVFREWRPDGADPLFLPSGVQWVSSATATFSYRPADGLELRAEYRHDQASSDAYFGGTVLDDPVTGHAIANRVAQDTLTGGVIGWF